MKRAIRIWRLLTIRCEEVSRLVSSSMEQELPWAERTAIRVHMWYCGACRRFKRQANLMREALRHLGQAHESDLVVESTLSDEARKRIQDALARGQ